MATRFYLPSTGTSPLTSLAADAGWEDVSILTRNKLITTKISSAFASDSFDDNNATDRDILFRQYVSDPILAQTISAQTLEFQIRAALQLSGDNMFTAICVRVVSNDGSTVRGTILNVTRDATVLTSTLTNRRITATTTQVISLDGDRIVVEIGTGGDPSGGNDHDTLVRVGDNSGSDLPEDDSSTSDFCPWVEFPNTINFATPRYWVGGAGNTSDSAHWSLTSGGAGGASVPTAFNDVIFDAASNATAYTCTVDATFDCQSIDFTNPASGALTFAGTAIMNVYGNFTIHSAITRTYSGTIVFKATTTGKTITFNSITMGSSFSFNGVGGGWTLQDTLNNTGQPITLTAGTLNTNGQTVTCTTFNISGSTTRTLTLGASTINCDAWVAATTTNLTFNVNTSTINDTTGQTFQGGGLTYNIVNITLLGSITISGANTFATLTLTTGAFKTGAISLSANQTITGTCTINGNSITNRIYIRSDTRGTARTISAGTVSVTHADFQDITGAGAGSWNLSAITGGSGDCGGNSGITFTTAAAQTNTGATGNWSDATKWTSRVPLPQDDVTINTGSGTITGDMPRLGKSINFTGFTGTFTPSTAASIFGSLTLASGMTLTGSSQQYNFEGRSTYTLTNAGKTWAKTIVLEAPGGTLTLQDALVTSVNVGVLFGTFNANNQNLTMAAFTSNVSSTRTITMGSGTWTLTGTGIIWNTSTVTGLTINANTSTIKSTDTSNTQNFFEGGTGSTFYNLWFARGASTATNMLTHANTFNDIKDTGTAAHGLAFITGANTTVTTFTVTGNGAGNEISILSCNSGGGIVTTTHNLVKSGGGTISCDYLNIQHSVATPGATWYAGTHSVDNQAVATAGSGWSFSAGPITSTQTITGKGRIALVTSQTETGRARITKSATQTETGVAKISGASIKNITGVANIKNSQTRTITGKGRVTAVGTQTITGKASIYTPPPKALTIAGVDYLPQYETNSGIITEVIQNKANKMQMTIIVRSGQALPREGSEVVWTAVDRYLFGGYISRIEPEETGIGQLFKCLVEVSDYSYIFNNKVARRSYENQTLRYIVEDLLDTYVDVNYGFTTTNVAVGPTITSINFDHISIRKCLEKLSKLTGYVWYVDYQKNLFFQTVSSTPAPEDITDTSGNHESLRISYDTSQVRNSVIVIGSTDGEESSNTEPESFVGDGVTRGWLLENKPSNVVSISRNGVSEPFSLDTNERSTDVFVYSFEGQSFRLTDSQPTPTIGDDIEIVYYPRVPIIAQEIDPESIAFFAALDGGDGYMEYTIKDSTITTKAEATERALQELEQYADPLVDGRFVTRTGLLEDDSIFQPGQYVTVNSPVNGITDDTAFLIQEVRIRLVESTTETEYIYEVRFGGRIVGIQEFLESLASEEGEVTDADVVITLESTSDMVVLDDDAATRLTETPPYKWGPGGSPQWRWNMSEWS